MLPFGRDLEHHPVGRAHRREAYPPKSRLRRDMGVMHLCCHHFDPTQVDRPLDQLPTNALTSGIARHHDRQPCNSCTKDSLS
jgi:hypothetical protein